MFEFYIAAREQKETGHPGIFSRQKHSTIIYVICLLLICLWFAGMVLVGGYARQLWVLWIVKAEVTVEAETPAFKQSTQHYFFKKQPLPVVESVEEEDDPGVAVENAPSSSEDEENTVEESEEKAGLRERVRQDHRPLRHLRRQRSGEVGRWTACQRPRRQDRGWPDAEWPPERGGA